MTLVLAALLCLSSGASPTQPHRKQLAEATAAGSRRRLAQCGQCPANAAAACSAVDAATQTSVRAQLVSKCGTQGFDPAQCCPLQQSGPQWDVYAACAW